MAIRILCEIETVGDSLTGRAGACGGEACEFTGWLGLLGVLQALVIGADRDADGSRGTAGSE